MEGYLESIKDSLQKALGQYKDGMAAQDFDYNDWKMKAQFLAPIVSSLYTHAQSRILFCEHKETASRAKQAEALDSRIQLYDRIKKENGRLSELDVEIIGLNREISLLSQEISENQKEISQMQNKIAEAKKEKEYWDTVFWATCWIPFANIGTGVKKDSVDGQYKAKVKILGEDTARKYAKIDELNRNLRTAELKQRQNKESSSMLANQITASEGMIAQLTNILNQLRHEIALWKIILTACSEIELELEYSNGNITKVMECFKRLEKVEEMMNLPVTDKYVRGCICKGNILSAGGKLLQNEYLLSQNSRFAAVMQEDNNFVIYHSEKPLWASQTWITEGKGYIELDESGLVLLKGVNKKWNTKRNGAVVLVMQDDGNLVTYDKNKEPLWASDTYTYANVPGICFVRNENTSMLS